MSDIKKTYIGEENNKCAVIEIDENVIGLNHFNALNDLVNSEIKNGIKTFIFNMSGLSTINSSGLGILISCLKHIKGSNCSLKIVNANEKILNIFKLTKLNNVFEFESTDQNI